MSPLTPAPEGRFGRRKDIVASLLLAALFMGIGFSCVDRMIGDPAIFPEAAEG